jgi:multiple sugar transport system substrate-binding protein
VFFRPEFNFQNFFLFVLIVMSATGCRNDVQIKQPVLTWYVFNEPSGAFLEAARSCTEAVAGRYSIELRPLPADADQQREQLVRRLASGDSAIDMIGMDVIWTAEFAEAGWIRPWPKVNAERASTGRLAATLASARYHDRLWAVPYTANAQLLWLRKDRVNAAPTTWNDLIDQADATGAPGALQLQGQRYEGLTMFFVSLLASAGGSVLDR